MGALGLVTAQALAEEGAKSLLLMSRRGDKQLEGGKGVFVWNVWTSYWYSLDMLFPEFFAGDQ